MCELKPRYASAELGQPMSNPTLIASHVAPGQLGTIIIIIIIIIKES